MRRRARKRQEKREVSGPISKRRRAALLRSFRGAARRKNCLFEGSVWGNWDLREDQQPLRLDLKGVGDHSTTFKRLLIGAAIGLSYWVTNNNAA